MSSSESLKLLFLAIESSTRQISVAVGSAESAPVSVTLTPDQGASAHLIPVIKELLAKFGGPSVQIHGVGVNQGPGSFTGLRIGVTTAKTLAYAWRSALIGLEAPHILAWQARHEVTPEERGETVLWTIQDAQRGELFVARFQRTGDNRFCQTNQVKLVTRDELLNQIAVGDWLTGPAVDRLAKELTERGGRVVDAAAHQPHAAQWIDLLIDVANSDPNVRQSDVDPRVFTLLPIYIRPSAAEEKRGMVQ